MDTTQNNTERGLVNSLRDVRARRRAFGLEQLTATQNAVTGWLRDMGDSRPEVRRVRVRRPSYLLARNRIEVPSFNPITKTITVDAEFVARSNASSATNALNRSFATAWDRLAMVVSFALVAYPASLIVDNIDVLSVVLGPSRVDLGAGTIALLVLSFIATALTPAAAVVVVLVVAASLVQAIVRRRDMASAHVRGIEGYSAELDTPLRRKTLISTIADAVTPIPNNRQRQKTYETHGSREHCNCR